jgi:alkanesulfonate monooxygenase SsuD/methylene tetrahydromethanopterin reductase-like flavin-dependent oxidoreductase (luciferase family)
MPDFPQLQPSPGPTLAVAAALTELRVGTWVYASPLRPAWSAAWEAHSLSVLTEGRFEMGVGPEGRGSKMSSVTWACPSYHRASG